MASSSDYCSSPSSSFDDEEDDLSFEGSPVQDHKAALKSFQTKFTYVKEPRKRTRTSLQQLEVLINFFDKQPCPTIKQRKQLAEKTGMTPRCVQVWFQNRRAKGRSTNGQEQPQPQPQKKASPAPSSTAAPTPASAAPTTTAAADIMMPPPVVNFTPYVPFQSFLTVGPQSQQEAVQFVQYQPTFMQPTYSHIQQQPCEQLVEDQLGFDSPPSFSDDSFDSFDDSVKHEESYDFFEFTTPIY